ncbi:MAG: hypothetical protein K6G40_02785 [Eubacterium sp.]|nr:hypothetical protein [Eubacterium sp.]
MLKYSGFKRIIAAAITAAVILVLFLSAFYIAEHMNHECSGEDCPICETIYQCTNNINQLSLAAVVLACVFAAISYLSEIKEEYSFIAPINSLISQKVRLND